MGGIPIRCVGWAGSVLLIGCNSVGSNQFALPPTRMYFEDVADAKL